MSSPSLTPGRVNPRSALFDPRPSPGEFSFDTEDASLRAPCTSASDMQTQLPVCLEHARMSEAAASMALLTSCGVEWEDPDSVTGISIDQLFQDSTDPCLADPQFLEYIRLDSLCDTAQPAPTHAAPCKHHPTIRLCSSVSSSSCGSSTMATQDSASGCPKTEPSSSSTPSTNSCMHACIDNIPGSPPSSTWTGKLPNGPSTSNRRSSLRGLPPPLPAIIERPDYESQEELEPELNANPMNKSVQEASDCSTEVSLPSSLMTLVADAVGSAPQLSSAKTITSISTWATEQLTHNLGSAAPNPLMLDCYGSSSAADLSSHTPSHSSSLRGILGPLYSPRSQSLTQKSASTEERSDDASLPLALHHMPRSAPLAPAAGSPNSGPFPSVRVRAISSPDDGCGQNLRSPRSSVRSTPASPISALRQVLRHGKLSLESDTQPDAQEGKCATLLQRLASVRLGRRSRDNEDMVKRGLHG